ncbi:hypothetical protein BDV96DRAFT_651863 [Lophiotrema nucula]|uniref:F-box domain-containing protein n=1 Tax=Lophiotrema nucula TaxID=690887 RepID=A0A6A5YSJ0_9PLEO|nr:hypothetical protein BDV96DRAFT_651863 [Lophiotrema nucula]
MATLNTLPEELIDRTIQLCVEGDSVTTLASLSLVSKKFHRITEPYLYSRITVKLFRLWGHIARTNMHSVLCSFTARPHFAEHLRMLTVIVDEKSEWEAIDLHRIIPSIMRVISMAPNIQVLRTPGYGCDSSMFGAFVAAVASLPDLNDLDLNLQGDISIFSLLPILSKQAIEVLAIRRASLRTSRKQNKEQLLPWTGLKLPVKHLLLDLLTQSKAKLEIFANSCAGLVSLDMLEENLGPLTDGSLFLREQLQAFQQPLKSGTVRRVDLRVYDGDLVFRVQDKNNPDSSYTPWPVNLTASNIFVLSDRLARSNASFALALRQIHNMFPGGLSYSNEIIADGLDLSAQIVEHLPMPVLVAIFTFGHIEKNDMDIIRAATEGHGIDVEYKAHTRAWNNSESPLELVFVPE